MPAFAREVPFRVAAGREVRPRLSHGQLVVPRVRGGVPVPLPALAVGLDATLPDEVWAGEPFEVVADVRSACPAVPLEVAVTSVTGTSSPPARPGRGP